MSNKDNPTRARLLVVEDEALLADEIQDRLVRNGHEVVAIMDSGAKAIEAARRTRPDLVLMDVRLKGQMDGIDAAYQIYEQFDIPSVFLTGNSDQATLSRALNPAHFGYLIKPVREQDLLIAIDSALNRHRIERKMMESQLSDAAIFEAAGAAILRLDRSARIRGWNPEAQRLFGYGKEDVLGQHVSILTLPGYEQKLAGLLKTAWNGERVQRHQDIWAGRHGVRVDVALSIAPVKDGQGAIVGAVAIIRDITEQKQAEEILRTSEARLKAVVEGMPVLNLAADEAGILVAWNRECERVTGYSREEALGNARIMEWLYPDEDYRKQVLADMQAHRDGARNRTWSLRCKDGSSRTIEWLTISRLIPIAGWSTWAVGVDVTERERVHAELQRAKESAIAASEAKSTFLATMSHEIRTPMNGILGMTELVLDTDLTVEQRENLGLVRLSAESLLLIINDILDFSKIEAGKFELDSISFDLRESLHETMKTLGFRTHQKGLDLIYDIHPDVPEAVLGDPGRIRQVLVNLVGNAIKFTEQGEIFVSVKEESQSPSSTLLHFTVKDTGIGIPEDRQRKIFEAFSQADGSTTRKYGGTGLGLTISTRLVEMMGGRIWLESREGKGSTFHFTVQLGVQDTPSSRPPAFQPEQLRDLQTLIVDDNFTNRRVLQGMLLRWGMKPTVAEGGLAALHALETAKRSGHPIALILTDGRMPGMDGFALVERIKKEPAFAGIPMIMLTSGGHPGDAGRSLALGISVYLVKPVCQRELLDAICQTLRQSPEQTSASSAAGTRALKEAKERWRILLAEDNASNRILALRVLEKQGYQVTVASDGQETLAALEKETFDLVLMDVQMPRMDGFEATAAIRESEKLAGGHIPIIAITANALKGDAERCLSAGMDGYVSKPIRTQELFAAIDKMMSEYGGQNGGRDVTDADRPLASNESTTGAEFETKA